MNDKEHTDPELTVHASGRYLRLLERDNWEYASRANARGVVVLVPLTDDDHLLLVEQYRTPVQARVIELPAGLIGDVDDRGESLFTAARRELLEETGYQAEAWSVLLECPSSAGMSDEIITFVLARELRKAGPGGGDASEDIQLHKVPLSEVDSWMRDRVSAGMLVDPKIYSALYWLKFPDAAPSWRSDS